MIQVRDVFQAKYGKGGELVQLFKDGFAEWGMTNVRILTDASGQFFTVVTEREYSDFADWEANFAKIQEHPTFGEWFSKMELLVVTGRREFFNVE
jgi:hypothetical protein